MRRVTIFLLAALLLSASTPSTFAFEDNSFEAVAADVIVIRPFSFVATVIGSALFVVSLPIAAISHSTSETAEALVKRPARFTFTRPVGELSAMVD
jgi:hypothetical protein